MQRAGLRLLWQSLPLLAAVALYGYALRLPFYLDDGILLRIIPLEPGQPPVFGIWGGSVSFGYYRPIAFTVWEVNQWLMGGGRFDPLALHTLSVFAFGLTGCVWGLVVRRLLGGRGAAPELAGGIAGLAVVIFPYSYNAVPWVASQFHLFAALGLAVSVYAALRWLDGGIATWRRWAFAALCWGAAFVAVFSHENAILLVPLLGLLILARYGVGALRQRRTWILCLPVGVIAAIFLACFLTLPRGAGAVEIQWGDIGTSLGLFWQGLAYPVIGVFKRLTGIELVMPDTGLLWLIAALTVLPVLAWTFYRDRPSGRLALYGLVWFVLLALPTVFLLPDEYVLGSWRLASMSWLGGALFWAVVITTLWRSKVALMRGMALALCAAALIVSIAFLMQRRDDALRLARYNDALHTLIAAQNPRAPLAINAPSFIGAVPSDRWFLTVGMGVVLNAAYVDMAQPFGAESGSALSRIETLVDADIFMPPADTDYAPFQTLPPGDKRAQLLAADALYVTVWEGRDFYPVYVGGAALGGSDIPMADFGGLALMDDAALAQTAPDTVEIRTRWRMDSPRDASLALEVFCGGERVGGIEAAPWGGAYPFRLWEAGETRTDVRTLRLARPVDSGCLIVTVGVVGADGVPLGEPVTLLR